VKPLSERLLEETESLVEKKETKDKFPGLNNEEEVTFDKNSRFKKVMDQIYRKIDNRPRAKQLELQRSLIVDLLDKVLGKSINDIKLIDTARVFLRNSFKAKVKKNGKE